MTLIAFQEQTRITLDIDDLLHDTYLLVVELRQGAFVPNRQRLQQLSMAQIEQVRQRLDEAGVDQKSAAHISHAQCALLDETVLTRAQPDVREQWASEPLQAKLFNRHQAGEFLYEDMRQVLREPAPDQRVVTAFQRVLMLGFQGRYKAPDDPEREQLLAALNAHVAPLEVNRAFTRATGSQLFGPSLRRRAPWMHIGLAVLVLAGVWWAMDRLLLGVVAALWPAGA